MNTFQGAMLMYPFGSHQCTHSGRGAGCIVRHITVATINVTQNCSVEILKTTLPKPKWTCKFMLKFIKHATPALLRPVHNSEMEVRNHVVPGGE